MVFGLATRGQQRQILWADSQIEQARAAALFPFYKPLVGLPLTPMSQSTVRTGNRPIMMSCTVSACGCGLT